jgi:nitrate/TMAO reductase-like tetraheme cytochrome c subunit
MDLTSRTTYYIMFNPRLITGNDQEPPLSFTDNSLNTASPIIKKFTTVSEVVLSAEINHETENWEANPHGYYTNNVNTCSNCHGTHKSEKSKLDKPDPTKIPNLDSNAANYCMACHDGTTAAPLPDVSDYVSDHSNPENLENPERKPIASTHDTELKSNTGSCTSCHNPHLTWSEENPNLLKDHFVYEHKDSAVDSEGKKIGKIDSRKKLCENCHDNDTSNKKDLAFNNTNGEAYKILHYRKSSSAIGTISNLGEVEDYDLCFSCHNPDKEVETIIPAGNKIFDILSFYADTSSGHIITAEDGSRLNGPIPCAECHETHAATNKKLLKERFGHENQKGNFELLDSWSPAKEIEFCMKCHNGGTVIYGVNGNLPSEENHPKPTPNAEGVIEPEPACSSCHGGTGTPEAKARRAVHSPLEYSKSLPKTITLTE